MVRKRAQVSSESREVHIEGIGSELASSLDFSLGLRGMFVHDCAFVTSVIVLRFHLIWYLNDCYSGGIAYGFFCT